MTFEDEQDKRLLRNTGGNKMNDEQISAMFSNMQDQLLEFGKIVKGLQERVGYLEMSAD